MANEAQLETLKQGVDAWNNWRDENLETEIDLSNSTLINLNLRGINFRKANLLFSDLNHSDLTGSDLSGAKLIRANLAGANLTKANLADTRLHGANLSQAKLIKANLCRANLNRANLYQAELIQATLKNAKVRYVNLCEANLKSSRIYDSVLKGAKLIEANLVAANLNRTCLQEANLSKANLRNACLSNADLTKANLSYANLNNTTLKGATLAGTIFKNADLNGANLINAHLVGTYFENAILTNCRIYGISAWNLKIVNTEQRDLIISGQNESIITVDDIEVAQFINLLLNNERIRSVIEAVTSKVVLILGRFTPDRKVILDSIRNELRKHNYSPVLFDFEKPNSRDITETVSMLAHMARFIIADITDARSIPQELEHIIPNLPSVPIQPIIVASEKAYGMFEHFEKYPWVLKLYEYKDLADLVESIESKVILPAEQFIKLG